MRSTLGAGTLIRSIILILATAAWALSSSDSAPGANAAGPSVKLDFDISNGACIDIDDTGSAPLGGQVQVAVCLFNPTGTVPVAAYSFRAIYDDTKIRAPEVTDTGAAHDDNPDANVGATTFTTSTYPNNLGGGWDCSAGVGAYPQGDWDGVPGDGDGTAYSGGCGSIAGPVTLLQGPLAVITFDVLALGTHQVTLTHVGITDDNLDEVGSCNPSVDREMPCAQGQITTIPGNSAVTGKVYGNSIAPANVLEGVKVSACTSVCVGETVTDATGAYRISGLPAGSYTIEGDAPPPFASGSIGPVVLTAGNTLNGQDVIVPAIPTGAISGTVYYDSINPINALPGSAVQACPLPSGPCLSAIADGSGSYLIESLADGSYSVTAHPSGAYLKNTITPVTVSGGGTASGQHIIVSAPVAPPPGAIQPSFEYGDLMTVHWRNTLLLTRSACPGGIGTYQVTVNSVVVSSGPMNENTPGIYTAQILPLAPNHGQAEVNVDIDCPHPTPDDALDFNIYIDPSGYVKTVEGNPIVGATVTLYWSNSPFGGFIRVPDQHAIMSPANRTNPDMTDSTGHFGWDVVAGYYFVTASKFGCTDPLDSTDVIVETAILTIPPPVFDLDLRLDCGSPPCNPVDPDAENTDAKPIENGPQLANKDITIEKGDGANDLCDTDDDNDGLTDSDESVFPVPGCPNASASLNWLALDTDGDGLTDGWECAQTSPTSDPANKASKALGTPDPLDADMDDDRIPDLWEVRGYGGSGTDTDSDDDGCHDLVEVASVSDNKAVENADRLAVARRALNIWGPDPAQDYALDIDKNGQVLDADRLFVSRAALLGDWLPKTCP
jgi:hypothetical protein